MTSKFNDSMPNCIVERPLFSPPSPFGWILEHLVVVCFYFIFFDGLCYLKVSKMGGGAKMVLRLRKLEETIKKGVKSNNLFVCASTSIL